jgi:hypothetical protein
MAVFETSAGRDLVVTLSNYLSDRRKKGGEREEGGEGEGVRSYLV